VGDSKRVVAVLLAFLLVGCASVRWAVTKSVRDPGEQLRNFPEEVWKEYDCDDQYRPFFILEENELVPPRVKPAREFNHRMVYALCPVNPTEVVEGTLLTRIRFRGQPIVSDRVAPYELRPGRWIVDAFVTLPNDAEPGVYAYEIQFDSRAIDFNERLTFVVESP
jgi:hypothetical protein